MALIGILLLACLIFAAIRKLFALLGLGLLLLVVWYFFF